MAVILIDGFDKYGPTYVSGFTATDDLLVAEWTLSYNASIVAPLSSTGQAVGLNYNGTIVKTLPADYTRLVGGVRFKTSLSGSLGVSGGIAIMDTGYTQLSIGIEANTGLITVYRYVGNNSFLVSKTTTISVNANSVHYLEWDVTIGPAGAYFVYLDSVLLLSGNCASNGGTGANKANQFALKSNYMYFIYDDLYLFDTTGPTNNAVLLSNPRIETQLPIAVQQQQFTNDGAILGAVLPSTGDVYNVDNMQYNRFYLKPVIANVNMTLNTLVLDTTSVPYENWTGLVYDNHLGSPNVLLAQSSDTVGITSSPQLLDLTAPLVLSGGQTYWIGVLWKTNISINTSGQHGISVTDNNQTGVYNGRQYQLGPMTPLNGNVTIGGPSLGIHGYCNAVAENWVSVNRNYGAGDKSAISSNTPGNEDLYLFAPISSHPTTIYTVAVKSLSKLTDTGNRSVDLRMKSGNVSSSGSKTGLIPPTSYAWMDSFFDNNPNTSTPWTETTINNASSGIKIVT